MAGKIIADIIESAGSQISLNVGNVTILTASSTGLTLTPTNNVNINVANSNVTFTTANVTGVATFSAGSNTAPSITTSGDTNTGLYFPAADTIGFVEGGVEAMRINSSGNLQTLGTISVGNATPSTSGAGITFPATQSASSDANTLDDYEEGTFTPTLSSGFSSAPTSYSFQSGSYTKIGRFVYVTLDLDPNGATANATQVRIGGLPFVAATPSIYGAGMLSYQISFNTNSGDSYHIGANSTLIDIYNDAGSDRNGNSAGVNINGRIILVAVYQTT